MDLITVYGILVAIVAALLVYLQLMEAQKETSFGNLLAQFRLEHANVNDQLAIKELSPTARAALMKHRNFLMAQYHEIHNTDKFLEAILEVENKENRKINWLTICFVKLIEGNTFFYKMVFGALVPNTSFRTDIGNSRLITTLLFVILVAGILISTQPPSWEHLNIASWGLHRGNGWFAFFLGCSTSLVFARLMFHHSIIQKDLIDQWKAAVQAIKGKREILAKLMIKMGDITEADIPSENIHQRNGELPQDSGYVNGESSDDTIQLSSD